VETRRKRSQRREFILRNLNVGSICVKSRFTAEYFKLIKAKGALEGVSKRQLCPVETGISFILN
jgi:hypothetical protein